MSWQQCHSSTTVVLTSVHKLGGEKSGKPEELFIYSLYISPKKEKSIECFYIT